MRRGFDMYLSEVLHYSGHGQRPPQLHPRPTPVRRHASDVQFAGVVLHPRPPVAATPAAGLRPHLPNSADVRLLRELHPDPAAVAPAENNATASATSAASSAAIVPQGRYFGPVESRAVTSSHRDNAPEYLNVAVKMPAANARLAPVNVRIRFAAVLPASSLLMVAANVPL